VRLDALLRLIDEEARKHGVAFVPLKGATLHQIGLYQAGERPMADLDLFTSAADLERMAAILNAIGFRQTTTTWKHRVFESDEASPVATFGEHSGNRIKIDLHVQIREQLPRRPVDVSHLIMPPLPRPGMNPYRSQASLMAHLLLHAAGAMALRTVRLVQLHDVALLSRRMSHADWLELHRPVAAQHSLWWAYAPLVLVARYYGTIPAWLLESVARDCGWFLRRSSRKRLLWQLSFSDLRRKAFPGIEWSQSAGEAFVYATERTMLAAQVLTRAIVFRQVAGGLDGIASHDRQSLPPRSWVSLRPARPAPLFAVRSALAQAR